MDLVRKRQEKLLIVLFVLLLNMIVPTASEYTAFQAK